MLAQNTNSDAKQGIAKVSPSYRNATGYHNKPTMWVKIRFLGGLDRKEQQLDMCGEISNPSSSRDMSPGVRSLSLYSNTTSA
jgi:hypothetical protein